MNASDSPPPDQEESDAPDSPPPHPELDDQKSAVSPLSEVEGNDERPMEEEEEEPEVVFEVTEATESGKVTSDDQIHSDDESEDLQSPGQGSVSPDVDQWVSCIDETEEEDVFPPPPPPVFFNEDLEVLEEETPPLLLLPPASARTIETAQMHQSLRARGARLHPDLPKRWHWPWGGLAWIVTGKLWTLRIPVVPVRSPQLPGPRTSTVSP